MRRKDTKFDVNKVWDILFPFSIGDRVRIIDAKHIDINAIYIHKRGTIRELNKYFSKFHLKKGRLIQVTEYGVQLESLQDNSLRWFRENEMKRV